MNPSSIKNCVHCGKELPRRRLRYCSSHCIKAAWRKRNLAQHNAINNAWRKNNPNYFKEYHKKHYVKTERQPGTTEFKKGNVPWNKNLKGIHLSPKTEFTTERVSGPNNNNWKGGITPVVEKIRKGKDSREWRKSVFANDNYTCQKCKDNKGGNLHPHHIKNFSQYPELRFVAENGVTLCRSCHELFHKIYGTRNNNQEQLKEFLL